ncbi:MAG: glucuronate isomerase [Oscillospiraceae bacterium]|nr:glucuronate isomerase [Oscillospiraceae bacterium]
MKEFMNDEFMLNSETASKLYHNFAENMPVFDYHCHLVPKMMYEDKEFSDIGEIFLGGDHYKWRYMRSMGIDEEYITGERTYFEKFKAFCAALQYAVGNPLYHWTHLELRRYFGIKTIVRADTAEEIWERANEVIRERKMSPSVLINSSNVAVICTTDDPADNLEYHKKIAEKGHINAKVYPTFRPDAIININKPSYGKYIQRLSETCGKNITSYNELTEAAYSRIDFFHENGCRISDHAFEGVPSRHAYDPEKTFLKAMRGQAISEDEAEAYKFNSMILLAKKYKELGWAMQLHIGALRDNNTLMYKKLGPDTGFDSISDHAIAKPLSEMLDGMNKSGDLPKTILYTLNPKDNYVLGTMLGNFQDSSVAGKIQFGSAWWFNDQRDGMTEQIKALANLGALNGFVGMLTDSRSFLSYTRHEYFRRILCDILGGWIEKGEFPCDIDTAERIVKNICFDNAKEYFGIKI